MGGDLDGQPVSAVAPGAGRVSVGLPTFNRRASFERAAASVLSQDYEPIELVVSDNASTDGTAEAATELAAGRADVVVVRQPENIGPTPNFRAVAARASGSYFMWLGDDDWLDPGYLRACVDAFAADLGVAHVAGVARYHDGEREWTEPSRVEVLDDDPKQRVLSYFRQVGANGVFYGLTRRDVFDQLPPVPNKMGGDWMHLAGIAFLGRISTLERPCVHRTAGGATASLAAVAAHAGLGWFQRTAPQVAIAWFVFADIAWGSPVFASAGRGGRVVLGLRSAAIICRRFVPGAISKFVRIHTGHAPNATAAAA